MNGDWLVRAQYVFIAEAPAIDEVDRIAGGDRLHVGGGITHSYARDAARTTLLWDYRAFTDAAAAALRLAAFVGLDRISVAPSPEWRAAHADELRVSRSAALAGRVRCPSCRAVLKESEALTYALEGVPPGREAVLTCEQCRLAVTWLVTADDRTR